MRIEEVRKWLREVVSEPEAPPMFELRPAEFHVESDSARFRDLDMRVTRRRLSGILEIQSAVTDPRKSISYVESIMAIAKDEDPRRELLELKSADEGSQFLVSRTTIGSLPVVGPGGQVLIQMSDSVFMADITIRRRNLLAIHSERWADPEKIYRTLTDEFGDYEQEIEIEPTLGYFELSKYDVQRLLRPVFMFVIWPRNQGPEQGQLSWETARILPASSSRSIGQTEGLEVSE
jgi:hypothetical protein